jgi:alpha-L-glutamate ligase-like protein
MNRRNAVCLLDLNPRQEYPLVDRKSRMRDLCVRIGVPTPEVFALLGAHSALRHLPRLLAGRAEFVLKPDRGAGGRGILVITGRDGDRFVRANGQRVTFHEVRQHASGVISGLYSLGGQGDSVLIQERVVPDPAFDRVSYQGTPDVRVVLYRGVPAMAMLRLPTRQSGGRANLHQGAVGAGVDLATGRSCRAVQANRVLDRHPDTGESLIGFPVPSWPRILEMARKVSGAVGLGYLGVDVVIDRRRGPLLLEANARPGLAIQIANGAGLIPRLEAIDRALEPRNEP